jgi:hypothetical protein
MIRYIDVKKNKNELSKNLSISLIIVAKMNEMRKYNPFIKYPIIFISNKIYIQSFYY